jgi:uncharacterized SAM-binding protein YcdF (DUF218 family)
VGDEIQSGGPDEPGSPSAIVVLGCRVTESRPGVALTRRLERAVLAQKQYPALPVILSGGRKWAGASESEVMHAWWQNSGALSSALITEDSSLTTRQNAAEVARLCEKLGYRHIVLVTCDFHMARAARLFRRQGLEVTCAPAHKRRALTERLRLTLREWGAEILGYFEGWRS